MDPEEMALAEKKSNIMMGVGEVQLYVDRINDNFQKQNWIRNPSFYLKVENSLLIQFIREVVVSEKFKYLSESVNDSNILRLPKDVELHLECKFSTIKNQKHKIELQSIDQAITSK